jgi:hypothetical protein
MRVMPEEWVLEDKLAAWTIVMSSVVISTASAIALLWCVTV